MFCIHNTEITNARDISYHKSRARARPFGFSVIKFVGLIPACSPVAAAVTMLLKQSRNGQNTPTSFKLHQSMSNSGENFLLASIFGAVSLLHGLSWIWSTIVISSLENDTGAPIWIMTLKE